MYVYTHIYIYIYVCLYTLNKVHDPKFGAQCPAFGYGLCAALLIIS